ncbi:MAG: TetR/AcrR family transcriptional regulator [Pseudomonadota bacterium]|nr:TetR/AcrR family transcriptional regulator [Pseudomonadota bacterium]
MTQLSARTVDKGAVPETERTRLDPRAWTRAALDLLADRGVDAVRIEVLARLLGVTKGSFYWHFADRTALLAAMLAEWHESTTTSVVEKLWGRPSNARMKLKRLWQICFSGRIDNPGGRLETAIRQWALHDSAVAAAVAKTDQERLAFIAAAYTELGAHDPAGMARIYYHCVLGRNALALQSPCADPRSDLTIQRLLGIEPDAG